MSGTTLADPPPTRRAAAPAAAPAVTGPGKVTVAARWEAPPVTRHPVTLLYATEGRRIEREILVARPTSFDEVVVSVVREISAPPPPPGGGPRTPSGLARSALKQLRHRWRTGAPPLRGAGPAVDVRAQEPNNVAHLLLDILPVYLKAREIVGPGVKCVMAPVRGRFRELLDVLGVDALFTDRRVAGELVHVRGSRGLAVYELLGTFDCPTICCLPDVYAGRRFGAARTPEKLFLARRGERALLNHAEVERLLARSGYETVYMEDHPVEEQLALASRARHVVAIHGAAMALLIVNDDLHSVIELAPPHVYHQHFPVALGSRVRRYLMLLPEFDPSVGHVGWPALLRFKQAPFRVDVAALERALAQVPAAG